MSAVETERINILRLIMTDNIGPVTFRHLTDFYGSATEALNHINELGARGGAKKKIQLSPISKVEYQLEMAEKYQTKIIFYNDPDYPPLLKNISDRPPVLFIKGHIETLAKKTVALVGTRNASVNGQNLAKKMAYDLAENGYAVVSGMARGIDRSAHMGALSLNAVGTTAGVLGTPVNEVYPQENQDIYNEIADRGCLVSEFPFETPLIPQNFPRRNRIISGLSLGTLVIEAQQKSGSLITAREAAEQGREVMAVPGSPVDPRSSGPNHLIQDGAGLVTSASDVMSIIDNMSRFSLKEEQPIKNYQVSPLDDTVLTNAQEVVVQNLGADVVSVQDLISGTGLDARLVNIILVELEIAGRLDRYPGNRVSLRYQVE